MTCHTRLFASLLLVMTASSAHGQDTQGVADGMTQKVHSLIHQEHMSEFGYQPKEIVGSLAHEISQQPSQSGNWQTQKSLAPNIVTGSRFSEQHISRQIALWSLRQINESLPLIDDPWVNQTMSDMTAQMNAVVRTQALIAVPIINDNSINAFAVPGGIIGINTGTILASGELDEVASVLAHEIAHLSQRHYEHNQDNGKKLIAMQIGGLLAALAASSISGDVAAAAMIGSQVATAETAATHSRAHEREADRVGQQILVQAGYDAAAMPRFFERLYKQVSLTTTKNAFVPSFIQSHPFTAERLSESVSRAKGYPAPKMTLQENQAKLFDKLTWRLRYLTKKSGADELAIYAKSSEGARLALAMYLADHARIHEAKQVLAQVRLDGSDPLTCITHAHILTKNSDHAEAVSVLSSCQAIYPERRDLTLHLAEAYVNLGRADKALTLLAPLTERAGHDIQAWTLTQKAYEKSTIDRTLATIHALHARSQTELWRGKYEGALQSNAQAIKLAKRNPQFNLLPMLERSKEAMIQARDYKP